jgi:site-specific recombinase XerD
MESKQKFRPDPELKLMEQVRQVLRYHHYAYRTEQTYCNWIVRFLKFYQFKVHPREMGKEQIEAYLSHLAVQQNVAAATRRQALNAIMFLFQEVLDISIEEEITPIKAKKHPRPPVVMSQSEVERVLKETQGTHSLMAGLLTAAVFGY